LKTIAGRFDALFALTYMLHFYDHWVADNEFSGVGGEPDCVITLLGNNICTVVVLWELFLFLLQCYKGKAWKKIYAHNNDELKIDAEFTREGVKALLQQFSDMVKSSSTCEVEFVWK